MNEILSPGVSSGPISHSVSALIYSSVNLSVAGRAHSSKHLTFEQFISENQTQFPNAKGQLSGLLRDIGIAAKIISRELSRAGLEDIRRATGPGNSQKEQVEQLDVFANEQFIAALKSGGECCMAISEENETIIPVYITESVHATYIVAIDPFDGSSNTDVNASFGSIFGIYERVSPAATPGLEDILRPGSIQVAAGYIIYSSSTMLVCSTGHGVNGFTLDPSTGEFCLSHANLKMPAQGNIYSINEGHYNSYSQGVKKYIQYCKQEDKQTARPYSLRYAGSLVADFHRNLMLGGIFMYPRTPALPSGKLRLIYECNPLAFIAEQAGGMATDGAGRILDLRPDNLHERSAFFAGSADMVGKSMSYLQEENRQELMWYG